MRRKRLAVSSLPTPTCLWALLTMMVQSAEPLYNLHLGKQSQCVRAGKATVVADTALSGP